MSKILEQMPPSGILIVGEIPESLTFLLKLLREEGYQIFTLQGSENICNYPEPQLIDLILLQTNQQNPDSYDLCSQIKNDSQLAAVPVIFLHPDASPLNALKIFQVGAADYINYPTFTLEIITRIDNQISLGKLRKTIVKQNEYLSWAMQELESSEISHQQASETLQNKIKELTIIDNLTQAFNRRHFEECLEKEWRRSARERIAWGDSEQTALSLVLCSLDYFPQYRQHYGNERADSCLEKVAQALQKVGKRSADLLARFAMAEFIYLLPHTSFDGSWKIAQLMQSAIAQLAIPHPASPYNYVTLSLGMATGVPTYAIASDFLIENAQKALYLSQQQGGNRISPTERS